MSTSLQETKTNGTALLAAAMFSAACVFPWLNDPCLIGSCSLSGVLAVQIFFYHHKYPNDHRLYKVMVGTVINFG